MLPNLSSHRHHAPLIRLRRMALYKCVFDLIWFETAVEIWLFLDFSKMAAAAILDFWNLKVLTVGTVKSVELRRNSSKRGRDM